MPLPAANFYFILRNGFDKLSLNSFFFLSDPPCPAVREMSDSIPSLLSLFHIEELKKDFITSNISNPKCSAPTLPLLLSLSRACLPARLPFPAPSCRPPSQPLSLLLRKAARSRHLSRKNPRLFGKPAGENRIL